MPDVWIKALVGEGADKGTGLRHVKRLCFVSFSSALLHLTSFQLPLQFSSVPYMRAWLNVM